MHIQERAALLTSAGYQIAYGIGDELATTPHPAKATHLQVALGYQAVSGRFLYLVDLDGPNHGPTFDADRARADFERHHPDIAGRLTWHRSRSGRGWHTLFISCKRITNGKIHDPTGAHVGELLGDGYRAIVPAGFDPPTLHIGQVERLIGFWSTPSVGQGDRWSDRARKATAHGWSYRPATRGELITFLRTHAGPIGTTLVAQLQDTRKLDRSAAAGRLMQTLLLNVHKETGTRDQATNTRRAMALWMAADSFGKAGEKGYRQEQDGQALQDKILSGAQRADGKCWLVPFWAKGPEGLSCRADTIEPPAPAQPAHRPAGDRARAIQALRGILRAIEPDEWGRAVYSIEELRAALRRRRITAAPSTIRSYLAELEQADEIARGQIGNGRPFAILRPTFGALDNSLKPCSDPPPTADPGVLDTAPTEAIQMPQTADLPLQCIVDHQDTQPPATPAPAAPPRPIEAAAPAGATHLGDLPPTPAGASYQEPAAWPLPIDQRELLSREPRGFFGWVLREEPTDAGAATLHFLEEVLPPCGHGCPKQTEAVRRPGRRRPGGPRQRWLWDQTDERRKR